MEFSPDLMALLTPLFEDPMNRERLFKWGKRFRLVLGDTRLTVDLSRSAEQGFITFSDDGPENVEFTVRTSSEILAQILTKKADPLREILQGSLVVEGSLLAFVEFGEFIQDMLQGNDQSP